MYSEDIILEAKQLKELGNNISQISKLTGASRATIREWFSENKRYIVKSKKSTIDTFLARFESTHEVRLAYYYLLGQYLGDGYISKNGRAFSLRIAATSKYQNIIKEIKDSMKLVLPDNSIHVTIRGACSYVTVNSKHMVQLFPQHGTGRKHNRKIELSEWQLKHFEDYSKNLARGLFHSDGCRYYRKVYGKFAYSFTNCSFDIHSIFQKCLELNEVRYTFNSKVVNEGDSPAWVTLIYKNQDVIKADEFLGAKS